MVVFIIALRNNTSLPHDFLAFSRTNKQEKTNQIDWEEEEENQNKLTIELLLTSSIELVFLEVTLISISVFQGLFI